MKLLDKYIFNEFFRVFIGAVLLLTGIGLISKIMERLKTLIAYEGPFADILHYLWLNLPYIVTIVGPTALMFSISYTIANFSRKKELAVIMTSGRSFRRILSPVIIFAFVYSIGSFFLTEYISYPWVLKSYDHLNDVLKNKSSSRTSTRSNYHARIHDKFIYIGRYYEEYNLISSINIIEYKNNFPESIIDAKFALVIPNNWIIINGTKTVFDADHNFIEQRNFSTLRQAIPEGKDFLTTHAHTFEEMSIFQVYKELMERKNHGRKYRKHLVEYYWHYSLPFVSLFIVLIAGILGSQVKKGAMSLSISVSTMTTLVYYLLMYIGKSLAVSGALTPFIGAWFANIVFTILSIFLFSKYRI
jgi:lipopolysaccharide export system permease protein